MSDIISEIGLTREEFEKFQPYDYLVRNAKKIPDEIAITDGETTLTWKELFEMTKRIARELRDRGVEPGDIVATRLPPILSVFFAWAIFHEAAVFLTYFDGIEETPEIPFRFIVSNSPMDLADPSRLILIDDAWFEKIHMNSIIIDQRHYPTPDSISRYVTSSGTTGRPKLMPFSWTASIQRAIDSHNRSRSKTVVLTTFSIRAETGWHNAFGSALLQRPHLIARDAVNYIELMRTHRVDVFRASPVHLAEFVNALESTGQHLPELSLIIPVGGRLPNNVSDALQRLTSAQIGNGYGATEVGPMSMRYTTSSDHSDAGGIDPITEVQIVDEETHQVLPDGEVGLVRARTQHMIHEYPGNPEATERHFRDGWFYPGDYGRVVDNNLFLEGRADELINQGGTKIDPVLIEEAFADIPEVLDCAAFGLVDESGISRISIAYVADRKLDGEWLRAQVEPRLGRRTPRNFFRVSEIPLGETGKPLRRELVELVNLMTNGQKPEARNSRDGREVRPTNSAGFVQPFDYVRRAVKDNPDGAALIHAQGTITRRQLGILAKQYAMYLRMRGVKPGDIVMIQLDFIRQLAFSLAVFHEAAVLAPFVPKVVDEGTLDVQWLISNTRIEVFPESKNIVLTDEVLAVIEGNTTMFPAREYPSENSILRIAFSSGTTGTPKPIAFTVSQAAERSLDHESRTLSEHQFMSMMPPVQGMGWWSWYASVIKQRPYIIPSSPEENIAQIRALGVDSVVASPAQIAQLMGVLALSGTSLPSLRTVQLGGSNLSAAVIAQVKRLTDAKVVNLYGSTEVGPTTIRRDDNEDPAYVGEILPGVTVEIVDPTSHEPLPDGNVGLVRARSATMAHEYLGNPSATADSWKDGWFYSGDLGRVDNNKLYLAGRVSELINSGGTKVDPTVIDAHFDTEPEFTDHAAFAVNLPNGLEQVGLAYVSSGEVDLPSIEKRALVALRSIAPALYQPVSEIPRNELGKPMRTELTRRFSEPNSQEV